MTEAQSNRIIKQLRQAVEFNKSLPDDCRLSNISITFFSDEELEELERIVELAELGDPWLVIY